MTFLALRFSLSGVHGQSSSYLFWSAQFGLPSGRPGKPADR